MTFDVSIDDCVALIVDPDHSHYGQTAQITGHDWKEYGKLFVKCSDGEEFEFDDGMESGSPCLPQALVYELTEAANALIAQRSMPDIREKLRELKKIAVNSSLSLEIRLVAKSEFKNQITTRVS